MTQAPATTQAPRRKLRKPVDPDVQRRAKAFVKKQATAMPGVEAAARYPAGDRVNYVTCRIENGVETWTTWTSNP